MLRFAGTPSLPVEVISAVRSVREPIGLRTTSGRVEEICAAPWRPR